MTLSLEGRVAVVTGAGTGLGRHHALLLARQGAKVVVNDPGYGVDGTGGDSAPAEAVAAEIRALGGESVANFDSVASEEGAQRIIEDAVSNFGSVHILVNNAGILRDKSFVKMDLDDFRAVLDVHLWGSVYCTKAAWPVMMEQNYGRVVMTTSISGTSGNYGQSNYAAAKEGILGLMRVLSIEGERYGIRVNAISPAGLTRMTGGQDSEDTFLKAFNPAHVSPAVGWFASERCNVTGAIVTAAAGGFGRLHYFETAGVQFDPASQITVEMVDAEIERIFDLDDAAPTTPGLDGRIAERLSTLRK